MQELHCTLKADAAADIPEAINELEKRLQRFRQLEKVGASLTVWDRDKDAQKLLEEKTSEVVARCLE